MKIFKNTLEWLNTAKPVKPLTLEGKIAIVKQVGIWLNEELDELIEGLEKDDMLEVYDGIIDANIFLANIPYFLSLDLDYLSKYADKVNLSNYSKYCLSEQEAEISVNLYANGLHPTKMGLKINAYYIKEDEFYILKQMSDNKILKSYLFREPSEF